MLGGFLTKKVLKCNFATKKVGRIRYRIKENGRLRDEAVLTPLKNHYQCFLMMVDKSSVKKMN